jgi:hypothetical protein
MYLFKPNTRLLSSHYPASGDHDCAYEQLDPSSERRRADCQRLLNVGYVRRASLPRHQAHSHLDERLRLLR